MAYQRFFPLKLFTASVLTVLLLAANQAFAEDTPQELPAIVVFGDVYTNHGFDWEYIFYTNPWQNLGIQGFQASIMFPGRKPWLPQKTYGFMKSVPPRLLGPRTPLGRPTAVTRSKVKIDTDGDPAENGNPKYRGLPNAPYNPEADRDWRPGTSGHYNAAQIPFVVLTNAIYNTGVRLGDFAYVTRNDCCSGVWAVVGDRGGNNPEGEIAEATAAQLGIDFLINSHTVNEVGVTIQFFAHSAGK
jgi:hypothetical protein